jgi:hypothetical protein
MSLTMRQRLTPLADDRFNAHAKGGELAIEGYLCRGESAAFWLLKGGQGSDAGQGKAQKAKSCSNQLLGGNG